MTPETLNLKLLNISNVKLKLKDGFLTTLLKGIDGQDLRIIIRLDEFRAANTYFAMSRLYTMVLHPAGRIDRSTINIVELKRYRRGDVSHNSGANQQKEFLNST